MIRLHSHFDEIDRERERGKVRHLRIQIRSISCHIDEHLRLKPADVGRGKRRIGSKVRAEPTEQRVLID